jgi:hypothetical protein
MRVTAEEFDRAPALRQSQFVLSLGDGSRHRFLNSQQIVKIRRSVSCEKQAQRIFLADS